MMGVACSVDVVINNYNYADYLSAAIDSALGQSHPSARVIVVDDGSTDDSRQVIESYGNRVTSLLKPNGGQASAVNSGFLAASADLVVFLDSDDVLLPHIAERLLDSAGRNREAAKYQYPMLVIDREGNLTGAKKPPSHLPLSCGDLRRHELTMAFDMTWMSMSGNAFPRWVLERLLPMPEADFAAAADWYLQHLAPLYGPVVSLRQPGALYRVHGRNSYQPASSELDLDHVRKAVNFAAVTARQIARVADELGLPREQELLSVADLGNRLISRRFDPRGHPVPGDTLPGLIRKGWHASLRRFDIALPKKVLFWAWFVVMAVAPRPVATRCAEAFLFPERRTRVNSLLGRFERRPGSQL